MLGLLLERDRPAVGPHLDHAVGGRILDLVAEDDGAVDVLEPAQLGAQSVAVEEVVPPEDQRGRLSGQELLAQQERLRESVGGEGWTA